MASPSPLAPADVACSICGAERASFNDRPNRPASVCPKCHSVERHRAFAHAYRERFAQAEGFVGKRTLMFRPDSADKLMAREFGAEDIVVFDAMPRGSPDVVGDPSAMEFPDGDFDVIFANGALTTARHPQAVVAELARVLKRDGVIFVYESPMLGRPTNEITDPEHQAGWYGKDMLEAHGVGQFRSWGLRDLEAALAAFFKVQLLETVDPATGQMFLWCVGSHMPLPDAMFTDRRMFYGAHGGAEEFRGAPPYDCSLCGAHFEAVAGTGACPACNQPVRARSMPEVVREHVARLADPGVAARLPVLGFAMVEAEETTLRLVFSSFVRASLYGDYFDDNIGGVDARDLSRFENDSFSGVLAVGVFDFFVEQEQALAEAFRVLAPGGLLMVLILPYRLRDGGHPPAVASIVRKTYDHDYIPEGAEMESMCVGKDWYVEAMGAAGFEAEVATVFDPPTGITSTWFLGRKPA